MDGSNVAVVGGAGFIGSHVVDQLVGMGCRVSVIDNLSVKGTEQFINPRATLHRVDIADPRVNFEEILKGIDYVFNYASHPYIPDCISNPVDAMQANTIGPLRIIEAATKAGVKRILQVTSAEVYGNGCNYNEDSAPLEAVSTYAASKVAIDNLARTRFIENGSPVIVLRQFNCVGERETHPYVIPEIISQVHKQRAASKQQIILNLGNDTTRDFMHVIDAADSAIRLIQRGEPGQAYNLGSESGIRIYELAEMITETITGKQPVIVVDADRIRPNEIWGLKSSNGKIKDVIGDRGLYALGLDRAIKDAYSHFVKNGYRWVWE